MTKPLTKEQKTAKAKARAAAPNPGAARRPAAAPDKPVAGLADIADAMAGPAPADSPLHMESNDSTMHPGLHDGHDAEQHFDGEVHDDQFPENWAPPAELEAPAPRPGMVQRWVRMSLTGKADANNLAQQGKQGWRPRTLESVPAGDRKKYPTMKDPRSSGQVMVNKDLILCEMPQRLFDQMKAYYAAKRKGQVQALVDKPLAGAAIRGAESHGFGAPHVAERTSHVTTDRVPIVAADRV